MSKILPWSLSLLVAACTTLPVCALEGDPAKSADAIKSADTVKPLESTKSIEPTASLKDGLDFSYTVQAKKEFADATSGGKAFIDKYLKEHPEEKGHVCVVSDIDETLLDNRPFLSDKAKSSLKEVDWTGWEAWLNKAQCAPLKPTLEMLKYARSKGVAIFFITGRQEHCRRATIENLVDCGIAYDGLYMRKDKDQTNADIMKTEYRKKLEEMGYKILVNIGDQQSDLNGGHALCDEKLPNKMYVIK